ncbi:MAG: helix-turn-helix transcriptional regulator [Clostridiales bacterium]|nr:helix-turn-helix transcriptional regulator [Clostridiales bacterium]
MLDSKVIGEKIARLRKAQGLTQQELADRIFVTAQAVSGWERGQFLPAVDNLVDLCKLLNCKLTDILDENNLRELADGRIDTQEIDIALLISLAPFISETQTERLASCVCGEFDAYMLCGLVPFVSGDTLFNLLLRCDEIPLELISVFMPFLTEEQLKELIKNV